MKKNKDLIMKSVTELLDLEDNFSEDAEQYIDELTDDMDLISEEVDTIKEKIWWIESNISTIIEKNNKENQSIKEIIGTIKTNIKNMSLYVNYNKKETNEFIKKAINEKKETILSDVKKLHEAFFVGTLLFPFQVVSSYASSGTIMSSIFLKNSLFKSIIYLSNI